MTKKRKKHMRGNLLISYFISFLLLGILGACRDENPEEKGRDRGPGKILLESEVDQLYLNRVNDNGFADGDIMGVYIVDYVGGEPGELQNYGNRATNVQHTYHAEENKWTSAVDIYWKDSKTPVDIYGYYPFSSPEEVRSHSFEVKKDQSKPTDGRVMGGYEASDFLWGKVERVAPTDKVIRLPLRHQMSNALITLKMGDGFTEDEWNGLEKSVLVQNTTRRAQIDLATRKVTPMGEAETTGTLPFCRDGEFRAIVVPQTVKAGKELFDITVGKTPYIFKKEVDFSYTPGKMHRFTITVNKKSDSGDYEFKLTGEEIADWEADLASHESEMKEYIVIHVEEPGTLDACLKRTNKNYAEVQNLKLTGKIDKRDFGFMRFQMTRLQALNLKEVRIKKWENEGSVYNEDEIPSDAMGSKQSLLKLIFPDTLKVIRGFAGTNLTGSLIIPEGVEMIDEAAFSSCSSLNGTLQLPSTLKKIGSNAFSECNFSGELNLPSQLEYIGIGAFSRNKNLSGTLILPSTLKYLGSSAFRECSGLTGSISIPQNIKIIPKEVFRGCSNLNGQLILHDGITEIEENAFYYTKFQGELILPKNLVVIGSNAFKGNNFSGTLVLPDKLSIINQNAFAECSKISGTLQIPSQITTISSNAFYSCSSIQEIKLPQSVENLQSNAFFSCSNVSIITCESLTPPIVQGMALAGIPATCKIEVPELALAAYQTAPGWSEFKQIGVHHELICQPSAVKTLNKEHTQKFVLDAEGDWEVLSLPYWCSLSPMSGSKETELTLTVHERPQGGEDVRKGDIIFKLKDKYYTTTCSVSQYNYEYEEDEIITLQQASKGKGVNLVFIGDGYDAEAISKGTYLDDMKQQVKDFFGVEPYATYRDYFTVYTAIPLSQEEGLGSVNRLRDTKFETTFTGESGLKCNTDAVFDYVRRIPGMDSERLKQTLIVLTPNTTSYGGITQMWNDGSAISICPKSTQAYPYDSRGIVQHEAGGHGFGKLGDEYLYHNAFITQCPICGNISNEIRDAQALGWYANLSLTAKVHEVPWAHLINHNKYSGIVDVFEGGYMHTRGVYRSEQTSCMNNNIPYFSTISREAIVRRIKEYAGETFSFEEFVANDKLGAVNNYSRNWSWGECSGQPSASHQPPVIHRGSPKAGGSATRHIRH